MSKELNPPGGSSRYTDSEIELGLRALAIASGNARKASSLLGRQGRRIPARRSSSGPATSTPSATARSTAK